MIQGHYRAFILNHVSENASKKWQNHGISRIWKLSTVWFMRHAIRFDSFLLLDSFIFRALLFKGFFCAFLQLNTLSKDTAWLLNTFQPEVCFYSLIHESCKTRRIQSSCLPETKTWVVRILNLTVKESDRVACLMN